ncbi:Hypothetical_protein [Hexamita inflata]|uniref:Hypothetical_protein n=1 Tax=Hexamita inflata TaxID=28002 RepID=A0AA86QE42_9EUKA|nr:Hypothetical protein HINF_LOCUS42207 [Hexamita inflata]
MQIEHLQITEPCKRLKYFNSILFKIEANQLNQFTNGYKSFYLVSFQSKPLKVWFRLSTEQGVHIQDTTLVFQEEIICDLSQLFQLNYSKITLSKRSQSRHMPSSRILREHM